MTKPLNPSDLKARGYFSTDYQAVLADGVTLEDAMKPEFWSHINSHVPAKLQRFDRIQIIPEDGTWFADLIVLSTGRGYAKTALVNRMEIGETAEPVEAASTEVIWRGPSLKWCVERRSDKTRLKTNCESRHAAEVEALQYERIAA